MPKKRNHNFKQLQGSSSSSSKQASHGETDAKPSVNERLSELRKLEGKDAAAKKRLLAESVNQRCVPYEIQGILGVPETAPPKPKVGVRARDRLRTPGPAPPKSWVANSSGWTSSLALRGLRKGLNRNTNGEERHRPDHLFRFQRLIDKHGDEHQSAVSSLLHQSLKATAESWHLFEREDLPALVEVPLRLRLQLLSYISFYSSPISSHELEALLQGGESVQLLDLAGLVGHPRMSVRKLARVLEDNGAKSSTDHESQLLESWDVDFDIHAGLQSSLGSSRFAALTHLSLSHPGPGASWRDLLELSKEVPQLTHLSLAYWPRPTMTPNLATTTVSSQKSPDVVAGGSHYYSSLDEDMTEPAALIRSLSGHLLCLQWLDLEGCHSWIPALTKLATKASSSHRRIPASSHNDDWNASQDLGPSIFVSNWKKLRYLRCAQGWLPPLQSIEPLPEQAGSPVDRLIINGITKYLIGMHEDASFQRPLDDFSTAQKKARVWLEAEYKCTHAAMQINSCRRIDGCKPVEMDFGWVQRHVSVVSH